LLQVEWWCYSSEALFLKGKEKKLTVTPMSLFLSLLLFFYCTAYVTLLVEMLLLLAMMVVEAPQAVQS
jgi:hypothetical protein